MAKSLTDPIVRCAGVGVEYRTAAGTVRPLTDIDLMIPRRGLSLLAGPSGSGKSTLLRILGLLERPATGTVEFDGEVVSDRSHRELRALRRTHVALIFQNPIDNLLPDLSVAGNLTAAARSAGQPDPGTELLARLGLPGTEHWTINALSGGQQQRLAFGCALARRAHVILADEPTSQLDVKSADLVLRSLAELIDTHNTIADTAISVVVASHDPRVLELPATAHFALRDGHLIEPGSAAA